MFFIGVPGAHPVVHLGQLELPQPPDAVRRQPAVFPSAMDGVLGHASQFTTISKYAIARRLRKVLLAHKQASWEWSKVWYQLILSSARTKPAQKPALLFQQPLRAGALGITLLASE
ncbi:hypothetical protein J8C06_08860 [Chloracidobacterium validum]|uniref:Uncharacterized protein n=1 Tax=Chloracidobacterium validum TaxID=2821543 RepID=A0ABX8B658_9BACT|nr:hypothetical protein J8C06_08860 [Chloracidobacterium validum]